ncbi:hypothetical protein MPTK1_6g02910 [Marchantia polymorpha subsp. ruderalis]|uniref:Uncharacterized protein n=1 Tax=Marchantia polymorpha subsp. ruderalis TaxID=1480154 RepID=A0AAF6BMX9_MARPO|nr:hypothetical protein Mp_6g02910 [Marchantia polymorpha subsp. ruderalis]
MYLSDRDCVLVLLDEAILRHAAPAVQKLVEAIRQATSRASDGQQIEFSEEDWKEWEAKHPCGSRLELAPLYAALIETLSEETSHKVSEFPQADGVAPCFQIKEGAFGVWLVQNGAFACEPPVKICRMAEKNWL